MNFVDILLLLPLAYGLIRGLMKGLVQELASVLAILLGIYLAYLYSENVSEWLGQYWETSKTNLNITSYIGVFVVISLSIFALAFLVTKMLKLMALGMINRILGALFGLMKSLILLCLFLFFTQSWFKELKRKSPELSQSVVYEKLLDLSVIIGDFSTDFEPERKTPFDFIPSVQDSLNSGEILTL